MMTKADRAMLGNVIPTSPAVPIGMRNGARRAVSPRTLAARRTSGKGAGAGRDRSRIREAEIRREAQTCTREKRQARYANFIRTRKLWMTPPTTSAANGVPYLAGVGRGAGGKAPS